MLTISDQSADRNCQGRTRRDFLRIGGLGLGAFGLGALTLPDLLAASADSELGKIVTGKSVVLLFLHGGPSHIETFDPKMEAPAEFRSIMGETPTSIPGVTFGGTFPKLAQHANQLAVVRSFASGNSGHTYEKVASGDHPDRAAMGALFARVVGANDPRSGMPSNVLVKPEAIDADVKLGSNFETGALPSLTQTGDLGAAFEAFSPSGGGQLRTDMQIKIAADRFGDRKNLLAGLDKIRRNVDQSGHMAGVDRFQQQAFDVITRGVADAFDVTKEDPRVAARYDTSGLYDLREVTRWNDMRRASNLLGKQMLMARRLCEAGCGFVTVSDCGWDMHSNNNSPKFLGAMKFLGPQVDHAVSAFIEDVKQRGLENDILLIVTGEMGRTPRINKGGGRDHYGDLTPLLLFGGGLKMGQIVGGSDARAERPATRRYTPENLRGTIMNTLFHTGEVRVARGIPKSVERVITSAEPIAEVM